MANNKYKREIKFIKECQPYYIPSDVWDKMTVLLTIQNRLFVNRFLTIRQISSWSIQANRLIDDMFKLSDMVQQEEIIEYITDFFDWYVAETIRDEKYEMTGNLTLFRSYIYV